MTDDLVYLDRRANEERRAAFRSASRDVADIHLELANAYEFRAFLMRQEAPLKAGDPATAINRTAERTATGITPESLLIDSHNVLGKVIIAAE